MKALSLYQPWASLLVCGAKRYETRSWPTKYRGQFLIHAGKMPYDPDFCYGLLNQQFADALNLPDVHSFDTLPYGCIIGVGEIVDCYRISKTPKPELYTLWYPGNGFNGFTVRGISPQEQAFGDWSEGRYAWEIANARMLDKPVPWKGRQRLFNVPDNDPIISTVLGKEG